MTATLLPHARQQYYTVSEDLWTELIAPSIQYSAPDEAEREELLLRKLGARGWGRLHHFRRYYSQGWGDDGKGGPLSPRALEAFQRFLEAHPGWDKRFPSLFLTDQGHLELCWEDAAGKAVQVEFTPTGAEYYLEATEEEGAVPHSGLTSLAGKLAHI